MRTLVQLIVALLINAAALWIAVEIVPNVEFDGRFLDLLIVAFVFGAVNLLVRPFARLLTFPLTVITFGLFTFVVNGAMLLVTSALTDALEFEGGLLQSLWSATLAAVLISIVSLLLGKLLLDRD